jgi:hypothetical protein
LRSGYFPEAAHQDIPLLVAMEQLRHNSRQQGSAYYNSAVGKHSWAARLTA